MVLQVERALSEEQLSQAERDTLLLQQRLEQLQSQYDKQHRLYLDERHVSARLTESTTAIEPENLTLREIDRLSERVRLRDEATE